MKKPRYFDWYSRTFYSFSPSCFRLFRAFIKARVTVSKKGHLVPQSSCLHSHEHTQIELIIWLHETLKQFSCHIIHKQVLEVSHLLYGDLNTWKRIKSNLLFGLRIVPTSSRSPDQVDSARLRRIRIVTSPTPPLSPSWTPRSTTAAAPSGRLHCRLRQC